MRDCPAELLILIPIDETDLRAVIIPKSGLPHNHPMFLPSKVPYTAAKRYCSAIDAVGLIGTTTLRINKGTLPSFVLFIPSHIVFSSEYEGHPWRATARGNPPELDQ